jgi:hypothetical protein
VEEGVLLNGEHVKLHEVCLHQEAISLGSVVPSVLGSGARRFSARWDAMLFAIANACWEVCLLPEPCH